MRGVACGGNGGRDDGRPEQRSMPAGRAFAGHPVDVATGEQFTAAHDLELDGVVPIIFRRVYNTSFLDRALSVLGQGWVHNYEATLVRDLDGYTFEGHNGKRVTFDDRDGTFETVGTSLLNAGESMELRREGELLVVYHWHGLEEPVQRYVFSPKEFYGQDQNRMRLLAREIPSGHGVVLAHDRQGRVTSVTQKTEGRRLFFRYDERGLLTELHLGPTRPVATVATAAQLVARYEYDANRRLIAVYDAAGAAQQYAYDETGRVSMERGRRGGTFYFRYDRDGRCIESVGEGGYQQRRLAYQKAACVTQVIDALGQETLYRYNDLGQVESKVLPNGAVHTTTFDREGRIATEIDPVGATTAYEYDDKGNLAKKTLPNGGCQSFEYNDHHQPTSVTDPDGAVWKFRYERGALVESVDPFGCVTKYLRNAQNDLIGARTSRGNEIRIATNDTWTEESISDSYGPIVTRRLDLRLRATEIRDAEGHGTRLAYDARGWLIEQMLADGTRRSFAYDPQGSLVQSTDGRGGVRRVRRTPFGEPLEEVDPLGRSHRYVWDIEGRLTSVVNPKEETAVFEYDVAGRCTATTHFDGSREENEYDLAGRPKSRRRPDGMVLRFKRDAVGNVLTTTCSGRELQRFVYNAAGDVVEAHSPDAAVRFEYAPGGRVIAEDQSGRRIEYGYDEHSGLARRTLQGSKVGVLSFEYDRRGRMVAMRAESGAEQTFRYDARDLPTERRMGPTVERRTFDSLGRLRQQAIAGTVFREHSYDAEGSLVSLVDSLRGRRTYEYDLADQLVRTVVNRGNEPWARGGDVPGGGPGSQPHYENGPNWRDPTGSALPLGATQHEYQYDATGNLCARDVDRYSYTQGDRLERFGWRVLERNANGELITSKERGATTRYEWDPLGQLTKVVHPDGGETRFGYDALGRRVLKEHRGTTTRYLWSGDDLAAELTSTATSNPDGSSAPGANSSPGGRSEPRAGTRPGVSDRGSSSSDGPISDRTERTTEYLIVGSWPFALWEDGAVRHVVASHHGVPHELLDEVGRVVWKGDFDDWGRLVRQEGTASCRLRLLGQLADEETGLHYNRFRYYLPEAGQFISPDPVGLAGGLNQFRFAPNPVGWADPLGLTCPNNACGKGPGPAKRGRGKNRVPDKVQGPLNAEQQALVEMAKDASKRVPRGRGPLPAADADAFVRLANESGVPVRAKPADLSGAHGYGPVPPGPDAAHIHINGEHVPVPPGYQPPAGSTVIQ